MPTTCKDDDGGSIAVGDAVCVSGWDGGTSRPKVKRALAANLTGANAKTILGVVSAVNGVAGTVDVKVSGEVADQATTNLSTGGGTSRLVVTDYDNGTAALQCKLRHIDDSPPVPERFVVGSSDETGTLAIQPRHGSDETGSPRVFNVRAYGAVGDDVTDDQPAVMRALDAMGAITTLPDVAGRRGRLLFPPGKYFFANPVRVEVRCDIEGTVGGGVVIRCDDWSSGFIFHANFNAPRGGSGDQSRIWNIDFAGAPSPTTADVWEPDMAYTAYVPPGAGPEVRGSRILPANLCCPNPSAASTPQGPPRYTDSPHSWEYHYECLLATGAGHSADVSNPGAFGGLDVPGAHPWVGGIAEPLDAVIKIPGIDRAFFACTTAGNTSATFTGTLANDFAAAALVAGTVVVDPAGAEFTSFFTNEPDFRECRGIDDSVEWVPGLSVVYGTVVRVIAAYGRADAVFMARQPALGDPAETTIGVAAPTEFQDPAANPGTGTVFGDTFTEVTGGANIIWECWPTGAELPPAAWANGIPYVRGDKVITAAGTLFVCTVAGTSIDEPVATQPFTDVPDAAPSTLVWRSYEPMKTMILDNDLVWACRVSNAIRYMTALVETSSCSAAGFPNAGIMIQADSYSDAEPGKGVVPPANANEWKLKDVSITGCGAGVVTHAGDANGGTGLNVVVTGSTELTVYPAERGIVDSAFLGNRWLAPFVQHVGGPGFLVESPGSSGTVIGGYFELTGYLDIGAFPYTLVGGTAATGIRPFGLATTTTGVTGRSFFTGVMPAPAYCRYLGALGSQNPSSEGVLFELAHHVMRADPNIMPAVDGFYAWVFQADGWWTHEYTSDAVATAYGVSSASAAEGSGLLKLPRGFLAGESPDRFYTFPSVAASKQSRINNAVRNVGDRRVVAATAAPGAFLEEVVTTAGNEGTTWKPWVIGDPDYTPGNTSGPQKFFGDTVIPTNPALGYVFVCTVGGQSDPNPANEPNWAGAAFPGGFVTEASGLRWDYLGTQAVWTRCTPVLGASIATAANLALTAVDTHVTVTAAGVTATLPATPFDGECHTIKSNHAGPAMTTVGGNGNTIDGAANFTQAALTEVTRVRYSSAAAQWELV